MTRSLRGRLVVALAATAFLSVVLTAVVSVGLLRRSAADQARADLRRLAETLAGGDSPVRDELRLNGVIRVLEINGDELAVIVGGGEVFPRMSSARGAEIARAIDVTPLLDGRGISGTVRVGSGEYVYVGAPLGPGQAAPRRAPVEGIVMARPVGVARDLAGPIAGRVTLAALGALLVAAIASSLIARTLARPVRDLSAAARRIAAGDLEQRVPVEMDDELGALATTFNEMSESLAEAQRREREFLASVSHELRTPLTSIRGYAEALEDGMIADEGQRRDALRIIRGETDRLDRMVQDVMDLARLGARDFHLEVRASDLATPLRDAAAAHQARAAAGEVTLEVDVPDEVPAVTDPDRVYQIVSNLLENALRVTAAGGVVRLFARRTGGGIVIEISDTGPGIAAEDLPHVFERSYLWRRSKGVQPVGTGLGLAIVRELVTRLGGRVDVQSEPGRGTGFRVQLPASSTARTTS